MQNKSPNSMVSYNKGITVPDPPFMKSVLPVTSLFSTIKSGVQTSVTAAVKAGKIYLMHIKCSLEKKFLRKINFC